MVEGRPGTTDADVPLWEQQTRWAHAPDVLWRDVCGGVVVLGPDRPDGVLLSETGASVWRVMTKPVRTEEIVRDLGSQYSAPPEVVAADVATLMRDLLRFNLIQQVP